MTEPTTPPVACDMTDAPDTAPERIAEYQRLYAEALVGRDRTDDGIRFRFRADPGIEAWVRDLADREQACCAFMTNTVSLHADQVWWDVTVIDDDIARRILDELYRLPDTVEQGAPALFDRFADQGLHVIIRDGDTDRRATSEELGLAP